MAMVRNMVVAVVDPDGTERAHHRVPYGARLKVEDGDRSSAASASPSGIPTPGRS